MLQLKVLHNMSKSVGGTLGHSHVRTMLAINLHTESDEFRAPLDQSGVIKHMATIGLDREHLNGTVSGPHSGLTVSTMTFGVSGGIEFIIRCPEGSSASEYQLMRFWGKPDRREFRSVTGGVLRSASGAKNNVIPFQFQKVDALTYKVVFPANEQGEYGFLAPGMATSANMASAGKVDTFRIIE